MLQMSFHELLCPKRIDSNNL